MPRLKRGCYLVQTMGATSALSRLVKQHFGEQNIVHFTVHRDEKTPHIHCVVVPITPDGRLSSKDFVGGKARLRGLQDAYAQQMAPLGLERGLPKERTQARHRPTAMYYHDIGGLTALAKEKIAAIAPRQLFRLQEVRAELQAVRYPPSSGPQSSKSWGELFVG